MKRIKHKMTTRRRKKMTKPEQRYDLGDSMLRGMVGTIFRLKNMNATTQRDYDRLADIALKWFAARKQQGRI